MGKYRVVTAIKAGLLFTISRVSFFFGDFFKILIFEQKTLKNPEYPALIPDQSQ